ncbi:UDP-N-acetylglucosamine acyltransferase [Kiloniella litopenaei]|uniref:Acyl-[acyl-carrier-protein]--UDP-N-acetylglucosamine O-acyltransferase n=1 Tax=Kiloniella litopenaei TaxID=1549748 RepID=A0A0M2R777_9PROT|nr:UDP-N-acetylglucosamine acyltransferase [Kiloniella litopenaei]
MIVTIHSTAIIEDGAIVHETAEIGPYCIVGSNVKLDENVVLHSHVVVAGNTSIGEGTVIFPFASIGHQPQDLKFDGEKSELIIGKNNRIREHVTINPGTTGGGLVTKIGDNCLLMMSAHVAHDCIIGNNVILVNNATLGGHVEVDDFAIIGGLSAVHQFVRIGRNAMIGGMSGVENDVIPFGMVMGERARLSGLNLVGMKRHGLPRDDISSLQSVFKMLFSEEGTLSERLEKAKKTYSDNPTAKEVLDFIGTDSSRAICQPK